tara:strand:+ start:615 stop:1493 length:879 start_codon:yes stop_codon:yes gene_type:complete
MKKLLSIVFVSLLFSGNAYAETGKSYDASENFIYYKVSNFSLGGYLSKFQLDLIIPNEVIAHCGKFKKNVFKLYGDNQSKWPKPTHDKRYVCARNSYVAIEVAKSSNSKWQSEFIKSCNGEGLLVYKSDGNGGKKRVKKKDCYEVVIKEVKYQTWNSAEEKIFLKKQEQEEKKRIVKKQEQEKKKAEQEKKEEEEKKIAVKQTELAPMINSAKSTCKTLGFEEGTDKFTDCALKLYTQEVDNIVDLKVAEQKASGSSSSGSMTIYDPVRDRQNQIDRGMKMLGGGCTLGIDC